MDRESELKYFQMYKIFIRGLWESRNPKGLSVCYKGIITAFKDQVILMILISKFIDKPYTQNSK